MGLNRLDARVGRLSPGVYFWHNHSAMKRCVFALVLTCGAALGQQEPAPLGTLNIAPRSSQALRNALRGSHLVRIEPGLTIVPLGVARPEPKVCAVPLLAAALDPRIDARMPIAKPPAANIDNMPVAEGLPPCPQDGRVK